DTLYVTTGPRHKAQPKREKIKNQGYGWIWMAASKNFMQVILLRFLGPQCLDSPHSRSPTIESYMPTTKWRFRATGSASDSVGTQGAQSH
ncbi:hypothetical protein H110_05019, partial [Trichophyton rubrum MR1448]